MTALISTKGPISSIVTVQLDGREDWVIAQRQALLAWTGHTLSLKPQYNVKLGLAHWGNTFITGRGLVALAGSGQIYQVQLKAGETYIAHPRYELITKICLDMLTHSSVMSSHTLRPLHRFPFDSDPPSCCSRYPTLDLGRCYKTSNSSV